MSAKIIPFQFRKREPAPPFYQWLHEQLGVRKCYVVRRRTPTFRGVPWPSGTALLLHREYDAYVRQYEALFGVRVV